MTGERNPVSCGIDVGQMHDPSAIAVAEAIRIDTGKVRHLETPIPAHFEGLEWILTKYAEPIMKTEYFIRHITRLPLGTSYPDVGAHIADMLCNDLFYNREVRVLIDVTGVGRPIYDNLKQEIYRRKETRHIVLKPITFVHGETYNRAKGLLGKAYLVSRLQSLLQSTRIHAPDTREVKAMLDELRVYEIKVDATGNDTYGAKIGKNDDLATAAGLSTLEDVYSERITTASKRVY